MARLHIICGNCGSNDMFSFSVDPTGNCGSDGVEYPSVRLLCKNCSTLHPLGNTIEEDEHTYGQLTATLTAANKEIERLQEEPSDLFYRLRDEASTLRQSLEELEISFKTQSAMYDEATAALTTAREENERLTAENATLRAAVAGKTFFHSDEEVNAEMGRLRAKVERYGKALKDIALESSCSSGDFYRIHDISSDMIEEPQ